jgi:hypothetical protein
MTKEEYIRICEMLNGAVEDTKLAIGIINQTYNDPIYKKLFCMNFGKKTTSHMHDLNVTSRQCSIQNVYEEITKQKDMSKYYDIFKYVLELRVKSMCSFSGLEDIIKDIDITLHEE